MAEITQLLLAIEQGDPQASSRLLPMVYEELRARAARRLAREKPGQTLDATALVHEAYVRLVGEGPEPKWDGRAHFFSAAAEAMRRILVENARRKRTLKRGGGMERADVDLVGLPAPAPSEDVLALDEALSKFAALDPVKAKLVQLRHFGGLTQAEAAQLLGISHNTADKYWAYARAWLYREITNGDAKTADTEGK